MKPLGTAQCNHGLQWMCENSGTHMPDWSRNQPSVVAFCPFLWTKNLIRDLYIKIKTTTNWSNAYLETKLHWCVRWHMSYLKSLWKTGSCPHSCSPPSGNNSKEDSDNDNIYWVAHEVENSALPGSNMAWICTAWTIEQTIKQLIS